MRKALRFETLQGLQKPLADILLAAVLTYEAGMKLHYRDQVFDVRRLINQLVAEVPSGDDVTLVVEGKDAKAALADIEKRLRKEGHL